MFLFVSSWLRENAAYSKHKYGQLCSYHTQGITLSNRPSCFFLLCRLFPSYSVRGVGNQKPLIPAARLRHRWPDTTTEDVRFSRPLLGNTCRDKLETGTTNACVALENYIFSKDGVGFGRPLFCSQISAHSNLTGVEAAMKHFVFTAKVRNLQTWAHFFASQFTHIPAWTRARVLIIERLLLSKLVRNDQTRKPQTHVCRRSMKIKNSNPINGDNSLDAARCVGYICTRGRLTPLQSPQSCRQIWGSGVFGQPSIHPRYGKREGPQPCVPRDFVCLQEGQKVCIWKRNPEGA